MKYNEYAIRYTITGTAYVTATDEDGALEQFEEMGDEELLRGATEVDWDHLEIENTGYDGSEEE